MKTIPILTLAILLVVGCNSREASRDETTSTEAQGVDALEKQVDDLHEHVMQKMGGLYKWKKKLQALDSTSTPDKQKEIANSIAKLDSAYDGMMDWMHQYKPEANNADGNTARTYLEGEMEKIKKVDKDIESAISKAKVLAEK